MFSLICPLDQGQTQQGEWTLITWWGEKPPQKKKNHQDSIWCRPQCKGTNTETLKWQRPIGEGDQELEKRLVWEELI
jgi:hypothetical protein